MHVVGWLLWKEWQSFILNISIKVHTAVQSFQIQWFSLLFHGDRGLIVLIEIDLKFFNLFNTFAVDYFLNWIVNDFYCWEVSFLFYKRSVQCKNSGNLTSFKESHTTTIISTSYFFRWLAYFISQRTLQREERFFFFKNCLFMVQTGISCNNLLLDLDQETDTTTYTSIEMTIRIMMNLMKKLDYFI